MSRPRGTTDLASSIEALNHLEEGLETSRMVAAALGFTHLKTLLTSDAQPKPRGIIGKCNGKEVEVPRFDTDWGTVLKLTNAMACTGVYIGVAPLEEGWSAVEINYADNSVISSMSANQPALALCKLILKLASKDAKLKQVSQHLQFK